MTIELSDGGTSHGLGSAAPVVRVPDHFAWCLALLPLAATLVEVAVQRISPAHPLSDSAVNTATSAVLFLMAWKDASTINRVGANPRGIYLRWWGLFTPGYLLQRARAIGRGWIFFVILLASTIPMIIVQIPSILSGDVAFSLPSCNDSNITRKLMEIANSGYKSKNVNISMNSVDAVTEVTATEKSRTCSTTAHFSDGEVLPVIFTIDDQGDNYWLHIKSIGKAQ